MKCIFIITCQNTISIKNITLELNHEPKQGLPPHMMQNTCNWVLFTTSLLVSEMPYLAWQFCVFHVVFKKHQSSDHIRRNVRDLLTIKWSNGSFDLLRDLKPEGTFHEKNIETEQTSSKNIHVYNKKKSVCSSYQKMEGSLPRALLHNRADVLPD